MEMFKDSAGFYSSYIDYVQKSAEEGLKLSIEEYDDKAKVWHNIFFEHLPKKEELPLVDGACRVLDIGCNTGYNTKMLEERYGYAEGIDVNSRLLAASVLNHDKCFNMTCERLKYDNESFSLIVAKDVYEHSDNPNSAIGEAYRVLVDGGYISIMIPLDGEVSGVDDVIVHPLFSTGNEAHLWKATMRGVLNRLFDIGFTNVEVFTYTHSQLFGEARPLGDRVLVVNAQKIEGIRKVPALWLLGSGAQLSPYWAAFLTFRCTGNCSYCIQHICKGEFLEAKTEYSKNEMGAPEWIEFYNSLQKYKFQKLSLIGGEPTLHGGFLEIVNGINGYYKTVTTNLDSPVFADIEKLSANIENKNFLRINTSFHPAIISVNEFCNKVHELRDCGFTVDQIAMVDHPTSNFPYYYNEFIKRGLALSPQTFLGKVGEILSPNPEFNITNDYGEHGITDFDLYNRGFSCRKKERVMCMTRRFMVSPDGGIYRCHYHLYSRRSKLGSIHEWKFPDDFTDYLSCDDFGYCNPCDFPNVKFKTTVLDLSQMIRTIIPDDNELAMNVMRFIKENEEVLHDLMVLVSSELYLSDDPYWELYNNLEIREAINSFIAQGVEIDNLHALFIAQLDGAVFRAFKNGVNVYRLLDYEALFKYVDACGYVVYHAMLEYYKGMKVLRKPDLAKCLGSIVANLQASIGTMHCGSNVFTVWEEPNE